MSLAKKLIICTPLDGIKNTKQRLDSLFDITYLPNANLADFSDNQHDDCWGVFTNPNRSNLFFDDNFFKNVPNIKVICTASTGTVHIDTDSAKKREIDIISLKNETDFLSKVTSTAELAFTLMMSSLRKISTSSFDVYNGNWDCEKFVGRQVSDLKIGVLGYGRLGKIFANYCSAFGASLSYYDPYIDDYKSSFEIRKEDDLGNFLKDLDVLSVHIHATQENDNFIDKNFLRMCKKDLILINTSRGEVINEKDLTNFLVENTSASYATDVIKNEINGRNDSPIIELFYKTYPSNNIIVTPHIGGMSDGARFLAYNKAIDLFEKYLNGK